MLSMCRSSSTCPSVRLCFCPSLNMSDCSRYTCTLSFAGTPDSPGLPRIRARVSIAVAMSLLGSSAGLLARDVDTVALNCGNAPLSPACTDARSGSRLSSRERAIRSPLSLWNVAVYTAALARYNPTGFSSPSAVSRLARSLSGTTLRNALINSLFADDRNAASSVCPSSDFNFAMVLWGMASASTRACSIGDIRSVPLLLASRANATGSTPSSSWRTTTGFFILATSAGSIPKSRATRSTSSRYSACLPGYALPSSCRCSASVRPLPDSTIPRASMIGDPASMRLKSSVITSGLSPRAILSICAWLLARRRSRGCSSASYAGLTPPVRVFDGMRSSISTIRCVMRYEVFGSTPYALVGVPVSPRPPSCCASGLAGVVAVLAWGCGFSRFARSRNCAARLTLRCCCSACRTSPVARLPASSASR